MDIFLVCTFATGLVGAIMGWALGWESGRRSRDAEWRDCLARQGFNLHRPL